MNQYVLRGGDQGARRLELLARVLGPTSRGFLRRAGLRKGQCCLDVGCGIGAVTLEMARRVGPAGQAVGADIDARCLEVARTLADKRRLPATFQQGSVLDLPEEASFDLVYARFLLSHLPHPEQALARMIWSASPGGTIAVEDIDFAGHFCRPACPAFQRYLAWYEEAVCRRGGDARLGQRLLALFQGAGLEDVQLQVELPTFHEGPGKQLAAVTLEHIQESLVESGLATREEVEQAVAELNAFAEDPRTILSLPRIFQVCGRKRP